MPETKEIKLKVAEAIQDDVNKGIVRIDAPLMKNLGAKPGDIVEIEGEKTTVSLADRAYPGDIGLSIIRMDGITRRNASTGIGELVKIRTATVKEAKKIVIAPAGKGIIVQAPPNMLKQGLLGRAVTKGDIVALGGARTRRSTMTDSPFYDDVFRILTDDLMGFRFSDIKFIVADVLPKGHAIITDLTEVVFNPEAVEVMQEKVLEVTYEDIGGLGEEIKKIREMVELPLKHPEIFVRLGIEPPKGVLLHGPPGTGKTLLAKAVANETNSYFILINGPEIMSKYYGQSEENLRKKFEEAEKNAPSIIFIDELDAIAIKREESHGEVERRVVAQLLALMDGLKSRGKVVVIGATNIVNSLDPALRRPGRFDRELVIGVPDKVGRLNILNIHTRNMPLVTLPEKEARERYLSEHTSSLELAEDIDLKYLVDHTKGYLETGIKELCEAADKLAHGEKKNKVTMEHFREALKKVKPSRSSEIVDLKELASITHGYVGADLAALAKEAAMILLRRILPELKLKEEEPIPKDVLEKLYITQKDFREALRVVPPSAMREVMVETPNVKWEDIGGLEDVKQELQEAVEWPLKYPDAFKRLGVRPPRGVLIYGAPGTGKTLLAKAVANESEANFILVKGPELISKWVGESERGIRKVFEKARQTAPTIIFFDEVDSLAPKRGMSADAHVTERVVNQILTEMDGLVDLHDVVVIAATNRPDMLDTALLRPGRFDRLILTPVPDRKTRLQIFKVHTKGMPIEGVSIEELADRTENYVGSDIEGVCREAAMFALREDIKAKRVTRKHFEMALKKVRASVNENIKNAYEGMVDYFSSARGKEMKEEKPGYMG